MTAIFNIGTITFSTFKRIVETEKGYKILNILLYSSEHKNAHSSWLVNEVYKILSTSFLYKKNTDREFLFQTWNEKEFSFLEEDLDEVLEWLNEKIFNQE